MSKSNNLFTTLPEQKRILNFTEACLYLDLSASYMYKLTSAARIPFSKPTGKKIYFNREKLDAWLLSNPSTSSEEKEAAAATYVNTNTHA
ncbi:MAG: helix-turn-helix domain-containing protein [Mucilaginibacter sp.]